jgi:hypothetical protein
MTDLITIYLAERQALKGTLDQSVESRRQELAAALKFRQADSFEDLTTKEALLIISQVRGPGWSRELHPSSDPDLQIIPSLVRGQRRRYPR